MPSSREDDHPDRKRRRHSDSQSPSRRYHHDDDTRRHRSSRKDSPRRHSRSPSTRSNRRREYERRHPERSDKAEDSHDDNRRHRHRSPEERERSYRRHRDRDSHRDREGDGHRESNRDRDSHRESRRDKDKERDRHSHRHRPSSRSRSPSRKSKSPSRLPPQRSKAPLPSQQDAYKTDPTTDKEKPNFGNTGRLAAESNTVSVNGGTVVLKYHEPPEARKPPAKDSWRLYVFKGKDLLEMVGLNERSCWLIGRERLVVDFPLDHPSCSKQHAAIQFRFVEKRNEFGDRIGKVKPYVIDLESANGSKVNGDGIPGGRYIELRDKDMLQFGNSSREYVLMLAQPD